jgi:hypothetical protein
MRKLVVGAAIAFAAVTTMTLSAIEIAGAGQGRPCGSGSQVAPSNSGTITLTAPAGDVITGYCLAVGGQADDIVTGVQHSSPWNVSHTAGGNITHYWVTTGPAPQQNNGPNGPQVKPRTETAQAVEADPSFTG